MHTTSVLYENNKLKLQTFNLTRDIKKQKKENQQQAKPIRQNAYAFFKAYKDSTDKFFERGKFKRQRKIKK